MTPVDLPAKLQRPAGSRQQLLELWHRRKAFRPSKERRVERLQPFEWNAGLGNFHPLAGPLVLLMARADAGGLGALAQLGVRRGKQLVAFARPEHAAIFQRAGPDLAD